MSDDFDAFALQRDGTSAHAEPDHDEIVARAASFPGPAVIHPDRREDVPLAQLSGHTATPRIAAGARTSRPAATTLGAPASTRHNWTSLGPRNISGRIRALACADPTVAGPTTWYAGSAGGGVWKSTDGGARWSALWHDQPCMEIAALAIAPSRPERVYAATGEAVPASHISVRSFGVFVSDDAGLTWTNHGADVPNPDTPRGFEAVAVDPADHQHCWAVGADGAFRTTNGGTNWTQLGAGTHYTDVAFAGTRLFLVVGTSTDGAGRVVRLTTPPTATDAEISDVANASVVVPARPAHLTWPASGKIAVAPSRPATAYVRWAGEDGRHLGIFRSLNAANVNVGTIRWDRLPDDPAMAEEAQGGYDLVLAVHPTEPSVVVTGQQLYVFVSNNANTATVANVTWRRIMSWELRNQGLDGHLADFHHVVLAGNPVECWVASDAGIARSVDWRTGAAPIHRQRFLADPTRPIPRGAVRWDKRDHGIGGAQFYDITQHVSLPGIVAGGLQDNGTVLRPGGLTWQRIFGADGGHAVFDPDDPYRLYISWYDGLIALQFPALLDVLFPGSPTADGAFTFRQVGLELPDSSPFVPETERHPHRAGRLLHARNGRLWGMTGGRGERMRVEPLGRSFELRVFPPPPPPPPPPVPTDLTIGDTQGAWRLGLVPGRYVRPGREGIRLPSRVPAPFVLAEGDTLALTINGTAFAVTFNAANGVVVGAVTVADVVRLVTAAVLPAVAGQLEAHPTLWETPSAVLLVAHDRGAGVGARQIALDGTALDEAADGLSRLGINRGTYVGDAHGAAVMLGFAGEDEPARRINRDLSGAPTLRVAVNGEAAVDVALTGFADPTRVTTGELARAIRDGLAGQPVDVHAVPLFEQVLLVAAPGSRVRLSGTAADRMAGEPHGASTLAIGFTTLAARHARTHVRNHSSLDLRPVPVAGPPLELVISDGVNATAPLRFTAADCVSLHAVTSGELHRRIAVHLAAHPAVQVSSELVTFPVPGPVSEIRFSPVDDDEIWVGLPDGSVFLTSDDGLTWSDVTDPAMRRMDRAVEAITCHPTARGTVYVGLIGDGAAAGDPGFLFKTTTGGPPWQQIGHQTVGGLTGIVSGGRPLGVRAIELDPADPDVVYVGTDAGVFRSSDGGTTWTPFGEGLPNSPVVDLAVEPVTSSLRAAMWTHGVYERRLDAAVPEDARLVIRATPLDDGNRPARAAPSFHTSAPAPVLPDSPDIKIVVRRPAVGTDEHVDGVAFDLLVPHDDVVAGAAAEVMVQVANLGALPVPPGSPPPAGDRARVIVLWAPVDGGAPVLPGDLWMRLTAGPLAGTQGAWTVLGDGAVARVIGAGDTGVVTFPVNWPALEGVRRIGVVALATSVADPIPAGPLDVATLVGAERRAAYREVAVRTGEADRSLVLRATEPRDILVEQAAPPVGTGVADRLGLGAVVGAPGRVLVGAPAAAATFDVSVAAAAPGPAIVLRTAVPIAVDLALAPTPGEVGDITAVRRGELALMIARRAAAVNLPIDVFNPSVGFVIRSLHGVRFSVTGGNAAPRLGLAVGGAPVTFAASSQNVGWFDLTGRPNLQLRFVLPGEPNVDVAVDLAASRFPDVAVADPDIVIAVINEALKQAQLTGVVECFRIVGLSVSGRGEAQVQLSGAAAGAAVCDFPAPAARVVVSIPPFAVDLTAGPLLHVDLTPQVTVRFDADPADIPDLAAATPADVRRAINTACELVSVPVRAEVPSIDLRVAASPGDVGRRHPIVGGAHLAELAVVGLGQAADATLFQVRTVLGLDELETGVANPLAARIRNAGNIECAAGRLRLVRLDLAAPPQVSTDVVVTESNLVLPPDGSLIHPLTWDPALPAGTTTIVMVVVDDDRPGRQLAIPPTFATLEEAIAFASARPDVALRSFLVRDP